MAVPYHTHTFEIPTATKEETAETSISNKVVVPSSLGTAAVENSSAFATAAQGALADTAVQPADLDTAIDGVVDDAVEQATAGAEAAAAAAAGTYANIVGALAASLSIKLNTTLVTGQTDYPLTSLIPVGAPEMAYVYIGNGAWLLPDTDYQIIAGGTYNTLRLASAPTEDLNGVSLVVRGAFSATTIALDGDTSNAIANASSITGVTVTDALNEVYERFEGLPHYDSWTNIATYNMARAGGLVSFDGYAAEGDCPPIFVKAISEPLVTPKFWEKQSADGRWWSYNMDVAYVSQFGAARNNAALNDAAGIQAAIDFCANKTLWMDGISYVTGGENLVIGTACTINWDTHRAFNNRIILKGTGSKSVRTQRKHPDDGADAAISCGFVITAASGVTLNNPFVDLYCDYSDTSQSNLGDDYDVAIMVQSVNNVEINNPRSRGYFREYGILIDCTADNANGDRIRIKGGELYGKVSLALHGPLLKVGTTAMDIADPRGKGGLGDFRAEQLALRGYSHHSMKRISDTVGGCLRAEGYLYGSAPQASFQGLLFDQVRFQSPEPKTVDIPQYRQVTFENCMVDRPTGYTKVDGVTGVADADCVISHGAGAKQIKWRDSRIQRSVITNTAGSIVEISGCTDHLGKAVKMSWQPALAAVTLTYTSRSGTYTRVGDDVDCSGSIVLSALDTADISTFTLAGLPYSIKPNTPIFIDIDWANSTLATFAATDVVTALRTGTDTQLLLGKPNNTGWAYNSGKFAASGALYFNIRYKAVDET